MDETKKDTRDVLDDIMSIAEEIDFQTGLLIDGKSIPPDLAKYRAMAWHRYLDNFYQGGTPGSDGSPVMGPQILFTGSEKQGKSSILLAIMRVVLGDPSFHYLQKLRHRKIPAEYGRKLEYFEKETAVYLYRGGRVETSSDYSICDELLAGTRGSHDVDNVVLMPKDPMNKLLRAALLVEGAIATAWKASFFLDQKYQGDNEQVELVFRTKQEMQDYVGSIQDDLRKETILDDAQKRKDHQMLQAFRLRDFPDMDFKHTIKRGELAGMKPEERHRNIVKFMRLLKEHKHFIKEIRWFAAPSSPYSGLSGICLVDSPGYKQRDDSNSAITYDAIDHTLFFNIIVELPKFESLFLQDIFSRIAQQSNVVEELQLNRVLLTLTKTELIAEDIGGFETEPKTHTVAGMIKDRASNLAKIFKQESPELQKNCVMEPGSLPPFTFFTGARYDETLPVSDAWNDWKDETNLSCFQDVDMWKNRMVPNMPQVHMHDAAQYFIDGKSAQFFAETIQKHAPYLKQAYWKQTHADFLAYIQAVDRFILQFLPEESKSMESKWFDIYSFAKREKGRILDQNVHLVLSTPFEPADSLGENVEKLRASLDSASLILGEEGQGDDVSHFFDVYDLLAGRDPFPQVKDIWDYIAIRFSSAFTYNWLAVGEEPDPQVVFGELWQNSRSLLAKHVKKALLDVFSKVIAIHDACEHAEPREKPVKLGEEIANVFGLKGKTYEDWVDHMFGRLDEISMTAEERQNRQRALELKKHVSLMSDHLHDFARQTQRPEGVAATAPSVEDLLEQKRQQLVDQGFTAEQIEMIIATLK